MIRMFNTYSFMDLLKDYNYVPEAEKTEVEFPENVTALVASFMDMIKSRTTDYDFMDLLGDSGYVPVNDNWVKVLSNDNNDGEKVAS